jgi:hypothetical protein
LLALGGAVAFDHFALGAFLAMLGLAVLAYGLTAASDFGWMYPMVLGVLLGSGLVLALFVRYEARAPSPMMPLGLFRSPVFTGANVMTLLLYFTLGGVLFLLPFNLIRIQGYSATLAGAAFLPFTLIMGGLSRWSGGLIHRYGAQKPLTISSWPPGQHCSRSPASADPIGPFEGANACDFISFCSIVLG